MTTCALATATLGLALSIVGAPHPADSTKTFTLDVSGTTKAVKKGEKGTLAVQIRPAEGYKVNEKGPLKLDLKAPQAIALDKASLARADAKGKETAPEFACGFAAREKAAESITVDATFVLCDTAGTICEMKKERVEVAVRVD